LDFFLEINGADANEPPIYFIAFAGDSGNFENVSSMSPPLPSSSSSSSSSSSKIVTSTQKTTTIRTMLLQRKQGHNRRCDREKSSCKTSILSSKLN
jgi:hypothetical protein